MKRLLSLNTNAPGIGAAAAALWAAGVMIYHVVNHQGVLDAQVILAAASAAYFLYTRFVVTPVKDPKDGNGQPLAPVPAATPAPPNVTTIPPTRNML